MRRFVQLALGFVTLALTCGVSSGSWRIHRRMPSFAGVWNLTVGSAAVYDVASQRGKSTVELAIVGNESVDGKDGYWVEISSRPDGHTGEAVLRALIYRDGLDIVFVRMILQLPGEAPIELSKYFDGWVIDYSQVISGYSSPVEESYGVSSRERGYIDYGALEAANASVNLPKAEDLGAENVTAPAGTFSVHHFRYRHNSGDVWVAEQAAPFGLVKALTKDHITITLARLAAHAKDKITATPQPFNAKELERQHLLDMNRDYPLLQDLWGLMNPGPRTLKKFWKEP